LVIEVRAPGGQVMRRTLLVDSEAHVHEDFTFGDAKRPDAPRPAPVAGHSGPPPVQHPAPHRKAVWLTLSASGGLLLIGAAGAGTREWEAHLYNDDTRCAPTKTETRSDRCGTNRSIGSTALTVAALSFVGAGIAGAAAGVLLLGGERATAREPAKAFGCGLLGLGIECGSTF
jgi:hypothetical protein